MRIKIAKIIFLTSLNTMKRILDLIAFRNDKKSDDYKFMKKQIMDYFYNGLKKIFKQLYDKQIIQKCSCNANLRNGYKDCALCGGSGFKNKETEEK